MTPNPTNITQDPIETKHTLREANAARQLEWDDDNQITLEYRGNELAGEVGEACNIIKKLARERLGIRGTRATKAQLAEELADAVICIDLIAMMQDVDLNAAIASKFNLTSEKYGLHVRYVPGESAALKSAQERIEEMTESIAEWQSYQSHMELANDELLKENVALTTQRDELQEIVNRLPKTADGVIVFPGMPIFHPRADWEMWADEICTVGHAGGYSIFPPDECYSTREAAIVSKGREQ